MIEQPLRGWKDIAAFLTTSPRSAQRWERELGMPVHRLRTTTGSVVSAYPSELDVWRRSVSAGLYSREDEGVGAGDAADERGGQDDLTLAVEQPSTPETVPVLSRLLANTAGRLLLAAFVVGLGLGTGWVWYGYQERSASGRGPGAAEGSVIRVTSGESTVRFRPGSDRLERLTLPGIPDLQVRAEPDGSEMTLEIYHEDTSAGRFSRVALLRLIREVPADLTLADGASVSFIWEGPPHPSR